MLACIVFGNLLLQSQTPEAYDSQVTFKAIAELVVLPVNVTDSRGDFVAGLTSADFRVSGNETAAEDHTFPAGRPASKGWADP
jgi:hypothetical protein